MAYSLMMEVPRITLIVAVLWTSPLTVSSQTWTIGPGVTCQPTCQSIIPTYQCRQILTPITQDGVCLPVEDSRGCCAGCVTGSIDASSSVTTRHASAIDTIRGTMVFDTTEQALIDRILSTIGNIWNVANMDNILNLVPDICAWGQDFVTLFGDVKADVERVLRSVDDRGGVLGQ
ncbi:unnamed protein product, partial [Owenia fusiformis]